MKQRDSALEHRGYAAGVDRAWNVAAYQGPLRFAGYADYQAKKIRTAIDSGLQRRPKRAQSAETFLTIVLPAVEDAIARRDARLLQERLGTLRAACNTCHAAEKVEFVQITEPLVRVATVSGAVNDSGRSPSRP